MSVRSLLLELLGLVKTVVVGVRTDDGSRKEGGASPVVTAVATSEAGTGGATVATEAPQKVEKRPPYRRPASGTPR